MQYRDPYALLPEIPVIDCDEGGATRLFEQTAAGAQRLAAVARRTLTAPVVAVLDWLDATKRPGRVALLGVSLGGATALALTTHDPRVAALILDSTHPTLQGAVQARIEEAGYPLSLPASWGVLMGGLLRTGTDMTSVDPDRAIRRVGDVPVLILVGGEDTSIGPDPGQRLLAAAEAAGVDATLEVCPSAGHAGLVDACPDDYRSWVLGFLDSALGS